MKTIDELETPTDFLEFFSAIPEDDWCVGYYTSPHCPGRHCAVGHVGIYSAQAYRLRDIFKKHFGCAATSVNDAAFFCPEQFKHLKSPKDRMLAALNFIISKKA